MERFRRSLIALAFMLFATAGILAQTDKVTIYSDYNFQGRSLPLNGSWSGSGDFDRAVKSIRVPRGYRVTMYDRRNYRGTKTTITGDWNPGAGAWWTTRVRSIQISGAPLPAPTGNFPVIYAQTNYRGPAMAVETDKASLPDWDGTPHLIRSIRVPRGWKLTLYDRPNYRGTQTVITSNISWSATAYWNGRTRSIRVEREGSETPSPASFPVLYAGTNFDGAATAIERDQGSLPSWDGSPHTIRSIRVPDGWFLVLYTRTNYRGESYNVSSNITFAPGDQWYNRIRSIKVYKGTPPIQPR